MTIEVYQVYKSLLWLTVERERLPCLGDLVTKTGLSVDLALEMIEVLEKEGVVKKLPQGIKIVKDVMWCKKRNRPCLG